MLVSVAAFGTLPTAAGGPSVSWQEPFPRASRPGTGGEAAPIVRDRPTEAINDRLNSERLWTAGGGNDS